MAKRQTLEEKLACLSRLGGSPDSAETEAELRKALSNRGNLIVERAARVASRCGLSALVPDLLAAFERLMKDPGKTDKGCRAKAAVIETLNDLGHDDGGVFLAAAHHVQMEPAFGRPVDTAAGLRSHAFLALARLGHPALLFELVDGLMDGEVEPRRTAVQVLSSYDHDECERLLRLKALTGDEEPDVLADCLSGLVRMAPERSVSFVARFLESEDEQISESAALALGEFGGIEGFECLRAYWTTQPRLETKRRLLLPMALTRCDEAFAFLLDVIATTPPDFAVEALKSVAIQASSDAHRARIRDAVEERGEHEISDACDRLFSGE